MKTGKIMHKISAMIMVFAMLLGTCGILGIKVTANASDNPVKMYYCDHVVNWRGSTQYSVYIQIEAGSAANKAVYVHYNAGSNEWKDEAATYLTKLDSNTEIWQATVSGFGITGEYAIKYVGDGHTYWDNNNGKNYSNYDILGQANVIVDRLSYQSAQYYTIKAVVKNLAYNKKVKVIYTQDNWATCQNAAFSYSSPYYNNTDYETWSVTLNLDENKMDSFQYYVNYEVNGQTYLDNNFGINYDRNHYLPLGS